MTIVRSKTSTFRLFEVTFLLEKWKLVCPISTFRVPRRSKSGWRKQDSVVGRNHFLAKARKLSILPNSLDIFDIRQYYIRILYFPSVFQCQPSSSPYVNDSHLPYRYFPLVQWMWLWNKRSPTSCSTVSRLITGSGNVCQCTAGRSTGCLGLNPVPSTSLSSWLTI